MNNKISFFLISIYILFGSTGNNGFFLVISNISAWDIIPIFYFLINFNSCLRVFQKLRQPLTAMVIFGFVSILSHIAAVIFEHTDYYNIVSTARVFLFIMMLLAIYNEAIKKNNLISLILLFNISMILNCCYYLYVALQSGYDIVSLLGYLNASNEDNKLYNVNIYAYFSVISLPSLIMLLPSVYQLNKIQKTLFIASGFILFILSCISGQKTGFLTFTITVLVYFLVGLLKSASRRKIKNNNLILLMVFSLIIIFLFVTYSNNVEYLISSLIRRSSRLISFTSRFNYSMLALESWLDGNPLQLLLGQGKNIFNTIYDINDPHNINAQIILETGIAGFVCYFYFIISLIRRTFFIGASFSFSFIIFYVILSNAIGHAFNAHASWILFSFIFASQYSMVFKKYRT